MNNFIIAVPLLLLAFLILMIVRRVGKQRKKRLYKCPSCQSPYKLGKRWCPSCHTSLPLVHFAFQRQERQPIYSRASRRNIPIFLSPGLLQEASTPSSEATTQRALPTLHRLEHPGHTQSRQDLAATLPAPQTLYQEAHQVVRKQEVCPKCHATIEAKALFCGHCGKQLIQQS